MGAGRTGGRRRPRQGQGQGIAIRRRRLQLRTEGALAEKLPTAWQGIPGGTPQLRNLWPQRQ
eukprot:9135763-Alexandrium_andersonii.AAC.1